MHQGARVVLVSTRTETGHEKARRGLRRAVVGVSVCGVVVVWVVCRGW